MSRKKGRTLTDAQIGVMSEAVTVFITSPEAVRMIKNLRSVAGAAVPPEMEAMSRETSITALLIAAGASNLALQAAGIVTRDAAGISTLTWIAAMNRHILKNVDAQTRDAPESDAAQPMLFMIQFAQMAMEVVIVSEVTAIETGKGGAL